MQLSIRSVPKDCTEALGGTHRVGEAEPPDELLLVRAGARG